MEGKSGGRERGEKDFSRVRERESGSREGKVLLIL